MVPAVGGADGVAAAAAVAAGEMTLEARVVRRSMGHRTVSVPIGLPSESRSTRSAGALRNHLRQRWQTETKKKRNFIIGRGVMCAKKCGLMRG